MQRRFILIAAVLLTAGADGSLGRSPPELLAQRAADTQPRVATHASGVYRMQRVGIIDRVGFEQPMVAAGVLLPTGWRTHGGVIWNAPSLCAYSGYTVNWIASSPDGTMGAMLFPGMSWAIDNTGRQMASACPRLDIRSVRQYLQFVVRQSRSGARLLDYRERPDVARDLSAGNTVQQVGAGEMRRWSEGGEVLIAYEHNGYEMRETLAAGVVFTLTRMPWPNGSVMETLTADAPDGYAFRAPHGALDFKLAETIRRSIEQAPAWQARIAQHQGDLAAIARRAARHDRQAVLETWEEISAMRRDSFQLWNSTSDRRYREFNDSMRGVITYRDPMSQAGQRKLASQWQGAYRLDNGDYVVTDDLSFNPYAEFGRNATRLEPAR